MRRGFEVQIETSVASLLNPEPPRSWGMCCQVLAAATGSCEAEQSNSK